MPPRLQEAGASLSLTIITGDSMADAVQKVAKTVEK